jgi:hypothetical protein
MALVSKAKAAKLAGVSRTTIHRYVNDGKLSMTGDKVDTSELIRVFGSITAPKGEQVAGHVQYSNTGHHVTPEVQGGLQYKISLLEQHLAEVKQDRDHWRGKTDELTELLKAEQDNIRLLTHSGDKTGDNWPVQKVAIIGLMVFTGALVWFVLTST